ncbi:hypothetical protein AUK22_02590 [bacterium CG2_30_54_10]|nr:MAG: hypothetical protein AUK22_02590 [bacterium CG2_30_54_10]
MKEKDTVLIAIIGGILLLAGFLLVFFVFRTSPSHPSSSPASSKETAPGITGSQANGGQTSNQPASTRTPQEPRLGTKTVGTPYSGSSFGSGSTGSGPRANDSEVAAKMAALEAVASQHREKVLTDSIAWAEKFIQDPNLATATREVYRQRLIPGLRNGHRALQGRDFAGAMREFEKALEDPHGSPVSKFVCYKYIKYCAAQQRDTEKFLQCAKEQAMLMETQDLSMLGIDKTGDAMIVVEDLAKLLRASKNAQAFQTLVDNRMKNSLDRSPEARDKITASLKKQIAERERIFDEVQKM